MYLLRYASVHERLCRREVSDAEVLPYFLIFLALSSLELFFYDGINRWDRIESLLSSSLEIGGTLYVYRRNGGAQGYDFFKKYFLLGWIVSVRVLLTLLPLGILFYAAMDLGGFLPPDFDERTVAADLLVTATTEVVLFWRLGAQIARTHDPRYASRSALS